MTGTKRRMSITTKLLVWCMALIVIFYATTSFLFLRIKNIVAASNDIVNVNFEIDQASQRMIQQLIAVEENRKRYEILQKDVYLDYVVADLKRFSETLKGVLERHPEYREPWAPLTREYTITLSKGQQPDSLFIQDATVNTWIDILSRSRQANQQQMEERLNELSSKGQQAARMGFIGLVASITVGLFGSVLIAFRLNRSLQEVRRGIRELGGGGRVEPVRVLSGDELGELAQAFNSMTQRLAREEQMRSDFISMLSHEIRTPLTSIRESVDLLADGVFGEVNERQRQFLEISRKETLRLTTLLERLMKVSSLESSRPALTPAPVEPAVLVRTTVERIAPAALAKDIAMAAELPETLPRVLADAGHLEQVLLNLVGNAVKFSPAGSRVLVSVRADPALPEVEFSVADQGPGIPEEEQAFVFQKYYRHASVRDSVDGVGLGLSISKGIVEAHGGRMWFHSEPGLGSRFCFVLPKAAEIG